MTRYTLVAGGEGDVVANALGAYLREIRERKGWSQTQLSFQTDRLGFGVQTSTISKIESGTIDMPNVAILDVLARALGVELDALLESLGLDISPRWSPEVAQAADAIQRLSPYWRKMILHHIAATIAWIDEAAAQNALEIDNAIRHIQSLPSAFVAEHGLDVVLGLLGKLRAEGEHSINGDNAHASQPVRAGGPAQGDS